MSLTEVQVEAPEINWDQFLIGFPGSFDLGGEIEMQHRAQWNEGRMKGSRPGTHTQLNYNGTAVSNK